MGGGCKPRAGLNSCARLACRREGCAAAALCARRARRTASPLPAAIDATLAQRGEQSGNNLRETSYMAVAGAASFLCITNIACSAQITHRLFLRTVHALRAWLTPHQMRGALSCASRAAARI